MKVERIQEYRNMIENAISVLSQIVIRDPNYCVFIESYKITYSRERLEEKKILFIEELEENIRLYKQNRLIIDYLRAHFDSLARYNFDLPEAYDIIRCEYEVDLLIGLRTAIDTCFDLISGLTRRSEFDDDYPEIVALRRREEGSQVDLNPQLPWPNIPKLKMPPLYDSCFDFDFVKSQADKLPTPAEKIRFYKTRLYDLKRWELKCDTLVDDGKEKYYRQSREFYPNFEALCHLEIKWHEEELEAGQPLAHIHETESQMCWDGSDTDLLELAVSLHRTSSLKHKEGKEITQKEFIDHLQLLFNTDIKDVHSKLSVATNRKMDRSRFLTKLKKSFEGYCDEKLNRK